MAADRVSFFVLGLIGLWPILFLVLSSDVTLFAVLTIATGVGGVLVIAWSSKRADPRRTWSEALLEPPREFSSEELLNELQTPDSPQRSR